VLGTWTQNGASGVTFASGLSGIKCITVDPARANDNYSINLANLVYGSGTHTGVFLRWTAGTGSNSTGYLIILGGNVTLHKVTDGVIGSALATTAPTDPAAWRAAGVISAETVGSDAVISASSTAGGSQSWTYTDTAASSPFLTGKLGLASNSVGTPASFTGPILIKGTAASTPANITSVTGPASAANTIRQGEGSTIAGTGFEASQSTGNTDLDGTSLTETAWSDTSITITGPSSGEMFGTGKTLTVTPATNAADSIAGQSYLPPTGQSYITFDAGGISGMSAASIGYGITGLAAGDQARFETTATKVGAPSTTCTVTVEEGTGNIELTNVTSAGDYEFSAWFRDASDATDSGESVITFDATVPVVASATINVAGNQLTITLTENAAIGAGGNGGITLTSDGAAVTATYDSISTTDVIYDLSRTVASSETITVDYVQPGAGITDTVGNEVASFSGLSVTNNANVAPTDITLSSSYVYTTAGANAVVGTLGTIDADAADTFTYTLVAGTGDTNNADFSISGSTLRADDPGALGVGSYSIRVETDDGISTPFAKALTIEVRLPTASGQMVTDMVSDMVTGMVVGLTA
jgi:hypothetical protein